MYLENTCFTKHATLDYLDPNHKETHKTFLFYNDYFYEKTASGDRDVLSRNYT